MADWRCSRRWWVHSWLSIWYWGREAAICSPNCLVPYTKKLFYQSMYLLIQIWLFILSTEYRCSTWNLVSIILQEYEKYKNKLQSNKFVSPVQGSSVTNSLCHGDGSALRVYTDIPPVEEYLTRPEFVISMSFFWCHCNFLFIRLLTVSVSLSLSGLGR